MSQQPTAHRGIGRRGPLRCGGEKAGTPEDNRKPEYHDYEEQHRDRASLGTEDEPARLLLVLSHFTMKVMDVEQGILPKKFWHIVAVQ